ncbi:MAG: hypothetical protein KC563_11335 [Nitrospira sp.]|nr:hypothetical protein [Nitrospira sp.]MCA9476376.1 hypothetical protein [Nitrospira sp.]MDR4488703.1 hypothetical protein [Nitrospirales bacterium]
MLPSSKKVEALKSRYQQNLTDLESLYGALSQKAFKGELDLSQVPLTVEPTMEATDSKEELSHERREMGKGGIGTFCPERVCRVATD